MNIETMSIKIEPGEDLDAGIRENLNIALQQNGLTEILGNSVYKNSSNFTCFLCDNVFNDREELVQHLKLAHCSFSYQSAADCLHINTVSTETTSNVFAGYFNYRYTCSTCGAKFKTFRNYITHNMYHSGPIGIQPRFDDARIQAVLNSERQCMADATETHNRSIGTFTCGECKTVFMQRDSYAMHMMMRTMNECCKPTLDSLPQLVESSNEVCASEKSNGTLEPKSKTVVNGSTQRLEDVTLQVDQDEYLKSVLDRVCPNKGLKNEHREDSKMCAFCGNIYADQDALAMHVMSDHAKEMSSVTRSTHVQNAYGYLTSVAATTTTVQPTAISSVCRYCTQTLISHDNLALNVLTNKNLEDGSSEHAQTSYKRKLETDTECMETNLNTNSDRTNITSVTAVESQIDHHDRKSTLHCKYCDFRMSVWSEYEQHMKLHAEDKINTLKKVLTVKNNSSSFKSDYISPALFDYRAPPIINSQAIFNNRRKSFSSHDETHAIDTLRKRSVSVGNCPKYETEKDIEINVFQDQRIIKENGENTLLPNIRENLENTTHPNIQALSSHEQRIIYSVFGKDLNFKTSKVDMKTSYLTSVASENIITEKKEVDIEKTETETNKRIMYVYGTIKQNDKEDHVDNITCQTDYPMCKYCEIIFCNKAIFYLHMGLHNVNNPWQCNVCGKICENAVDFTTHVIHM